MRTYAAETGAGPWLVLAHGAGAGHDHPWMRRAAERLAALGVSVVTFDFPYKVEGRRLPDRAPVLEQAFAAVWAELWRDTLAARTPPPRVFAGGKSMGGRIASQVAARQGLTPPPAGLVFFGYPLHPPGRPADRRDKHLPGIDRPLLFLHGTRDPFGAPDELRGLVQALPSAMLHLIEGGDHSLAVTRSADGGASLDRALARAAEWMGAGDSLPPR